MDLLTAVMHEMGHVLGFEHLPQGIMEATLQAGERLTLTDLRSLDKTTVRQEESGRTLQERKWSGIRTPDSSFLLFDEAKGEFFSPGLNGTLAGIQGLSFDPAQWDRAGGRTEDNGDDWIVKFSPKKMHG